MKLEWIGHACFRLTAENGTVIVTDPYDDSVGIRVPKLTADLVTVSHEHHDHNNLDIVEGRLKVAREARAAQVGGVTTQAVTSYHDDRGGALRGRNSIRIFYIDALKVVHMGISYGIWSGVGIVLVSLVGLFLFGQKLDLAACLGLGLIIAGVLVINFFSASVPR